MSAKESVCGWGLQPLNATQNATDVPGQQGILPSACAIGIDNDEALFVGQTVETAHATLVFGIAPTAVQRQHQRDRTARVVRWGNMQIAHPFAYHSIARDFRPPLYNPMVRSNLDWFRELK